MGSLVHSLLGVPCFGLFDSRNKVRPTVFGWSESSLFSEASLEVYDRERRCFVSTRGKAQRDPMAKQLRGAQGSTSEWGKMTWSKRSYLSSIRIDHVFC